MFVEFLYHMRARGLAVATTEWMTLMEALAGGLANESLTGFYHLARAVCVKDESELDLYDRCFAEWFEGAAVPVEIRAEVLEWLKNPRLPRDLTDEERARLRALDLAELRRRFAERLAEQGERHDRGDRWVGTAGTSPFGRDGENPGGIRVGEQEGDGGGRSAVKTALERRFENLRHDRVLDVRQIGVALRQLRRLAREGPVELDLPETIDATARNYGDIDLVFRPERKNAVKLLLLIDVGGSMTPHADLTERLFSAAHAANHFKAFEWFYFHNCPYDMLYKDIVRREGQPTGRVLQNHDRTWYCVIVGDAAMAPYELTSEDGIWDYFQRSTDTGLVWLRRFADRFPRAVWLNPEPERYWGIPSTVLIRRVFDMHPFTIDGLDRAIARLRQARV